MRRKLLVSRLGAGSITVALCAALPGCNLAITPTEICTGQPGPRGMSTVECTAIDASRSDTAGDVPSDSATNTTDAPWVGDAAEDNR